MKLNLAILSIFSLLCLTGCGGDSGSSGSVGGASPLASLENSVVQGRLRVGGLPVSNAEVQLRLGKQVLASTLSDELGNFFFDQESLSAEPVVAKGALGVDVSAMIDGARYSSVVQDGSEFVWVTEVTTLIHDYLESHPGATLEQADAAVGRSLGCPAGESVKTLSDSDIFDPATFQKQAESQGGDAALFAKVEAGLGVEVYDFSVADPYEALRFDGEDPHERVEAVQAKVGESDLEFGTTLGVLGTNLAQGLGWVVARLGTNTDPNLMEAVRPVVSLRDRLVQLQAKLQQEFPGSQWSSVLGGGPTLAILDQYTNELVSALDSRETPSDTPFVPPASVAAYLSKAMDEYSVETALMYANRFLNFSFTSPGQDTIMAYHKLQMARLGRSEPEPKLAFYDLRYNEITDQLLENLNFQLGGARFAIDMLANTAHSQFLKPQQANALALGTLRARELLVRGGLNMDLACRFRGARQLVPPKLDRDDVMVLPPSFPGPVPGTPTLLHRGLGTTTFTYHTGQGDLAAGLRSYIHQTVGHPWEDSENWVLPDLAQLEELEKIARAAGGGDVHQGLIKLGIVPPQTPAPIALLYKGAPGPTYATQTQRVRTGLGHYSQKEFSVARQQVWIMGSGLAEVGVFEAQQRGRVDASGARSVSIGGLFLRGSLSGNTQAQLQTVLSTGTAVKPTIEVSFSNDARAHATATYKFPTGQECSLDVTDRVCWQSNEPDLVEVSNLSGPYFPSGALLTTRPGNPIIRAALLVDPSQANSPGAYVTGSNQYLSSHGAEVRNIYVTPRNLTVTSVGSPAGYFSCTSFSASTFPAGRPTHHLKDVTNQPELNWTLRFADGQSVAANQAEIKPDGSLHIYDPTLPSGVYLVQAVLSGGDFVPPGAQFIDQAKIRLQL